MTPRLRREVRQIIFEHFQQLTAAWREYFGDDLEDESKPGTSESDSSD